MNSVQRTIPSESIFSRQQDVNPGSSHTTVSPVGTVVLLLLSVAISIAVYSKRKSAIRTIWTQPEKVKRMPCYRCRFFNNNPYLKCAIQPYIVLTTQAVNCSDYCSHKCKLID